MLKNKWVKVIKIKKTIDYQWFLQLLYCGFVAHRGQLSNQIIERFSKIYELKGVLNVSMLEPALLSGGCKVAIWLGFNTHAGIQPKYLF